MIVVNQGYPAKHLYTCIFTLPMARSRSKFYSIVETGDQDAPGGSNTDCWNLRLFVIALVAACATLYCAMVTTTLLIITVSQRALDPQKQLADVVVIKISEKIGNTRLHSARFLNVSILIALSILSGSLNTIFVIYYHEIRIVDGIFLRVPERKNMMFMGVE